MSGIKPPELNAFYAKLHKRGLNTCDLAQIVGRSRSIVTRVLNGSKRRGAVWRRLERVLMPSEIALLDVAHCSAWNTRRTAKQPKWTPAVAKQVAESRT